MYFGFPIIGIPLRRHQGTLQSSGRRCSLAYRRADVGRILLRSGSPISKGISQRSQDLAGEELVLTEGSCLHRYSGWAANAVFRLAARALLWDAVFSLGVHTLFVRQEHGRSHVHPRGDYWFWQRRNLTHLQHADGTILRQVPIRSYR